MTIVVYRLKGEDPPPEIQLAKNYPCMECGAPAGFACTGATDFCWRARLLSGKQWASLRTAYGRGGLTTSYKDFLNRVYQGYGRMGMIHKDPEGVQERLREFVRKAEGKQILEMIAHVIAQF